MVAPSAGSVTGVLRPGVCFGGGCRYTARYIDRVMQGALADGRVGPTAAAGVKEKMSPGGKTPQMEGSPPDKPYMINTKY